MTRAKTITLGELARISGLPVDVLYRRARKRRLLHTSAKSPVPAASHLVDEQWTRVLTIPVQVPGRNAKAAVAAPAVTKKVGRRAPRKMSRRRRAVLDRIIDAKATSSGNYLRPGKYLFEVKSVRLTQTAQRSLYIVDLLVRESETTEWGVPSSKPGSIVTIAWNLTPTGAQTDSMLDLTLGHIKVFMLALFNTTEAATTPEEIALASEQVCNDDPAAMQTPDDEGKVYPIGVQPARGRLVRVVTRNVVIRGGSTLVIPNWIPVEQTAEEIQIRRTRQESVVAPVAAPKVTPAVAAPVVAPATQRFPGTPLAVFPDATAARKSIQEAHEEWRHTQAAKTSPPTEPVITAIPAPPVPKTLSEQIAAFTTAAFALTTNYGVKKIIVDTVSMTVAIMREETITQKFGGAA